MVEQFSEIFFTDYEGKQRVIRFLKDEFIDTSIYSLKFQIELMTDVLIQEQHLTLDGRKLDAKKGDRIMTFEDYGIMQGASIVLHQRLLGGEIEPFDFVNINKKKKFKPMKLGRGTKTWRKVLPGICFVGICLEKGCKASGDLVVVNKEFYKDKAGCCVANVEIHRLNCPICKEQIDTKSLMGVGLYKCKAIVETMHKTGEKEKKHKYEIKSEDFLYAYSVNDKGKIKYQYIEIIIKPL
ncbi:hypothetical protein LOD99_15741 [Oopsacas minuta]|uniref:Ubiquitin-like domain-containing protein n=1 Tax=Oopsacas minuta TaxID=111878 RepID=A0AAV7K9L1_9METZ|nr:hypothetical protein LOD99_15741 [Oopsacas minuta]